LPLTKFVRQLLRAFPFTALPARVRRDGASAEHVPYFKLREALESPGCAICRVAEEAVHAYQQKSLLHENVNDPGVRARIAQSGGFCHEHAWGWSSTGTCSALPSFTATCWPSFATSCYRQQALATSQTPGRVCEVVGCHVWLRQMKRRNVSNRGDSQAAMFSPAARVTIAAATALARSPRVANWGRWPGTRHRRVTSPRRRACTASNPSRNR
jgi:hypothetical protein